MDFHKDFQRNSERKHNALHLHLHTRGKYKTKQWLFQATKKDDSADENIVLREERSRPSFQRAVPIVRGTPGEENAMTEIEAILINLVNDYQFDVDSLSHQVNRFPIENWNHAYEVTKRMYDDNNPPRNGPAFFMGCLKRGPGPQQGSSPAETQYPSETALQDLLWRIQAYNNEDLMPGIKEDIQRYSKDELTTVQIDAVVDQIKNADDKYIGDFRNAATYFNTFKRTYRRARGFPVDEEEPAGPSKATETEDESLPF